MGRTTVITMHIVMWAIAAVLFGVFVLPRWWELTGVFTHSLGTVMRIITGVCLLAAAVLVVVLLLPARRSATTPHLAVILRVWAAVTQALAGALVVLLATAEIWVDPRTTRMWLFGGYGAAAALAVLGFTMLLASLNE